MSASPSLSIVVVGDVGVGKSLLIQRLLLSKQERDKLGVGKDDEEDMESDRCGESALLLLLLALVPGIFYPY